MSRFVLTDHVVERYVKRYEPQTTFARARERLRSPFIKRLMVVDNLPRTLITTQNPAVFDYLPLRSPHEVRERVLVVRYGAVANISEDEADGIWQAYEAGVQYVGEIFRTWGIW
jgi:hypothetical protein